MATNAQPPATIQMIPMNSTNILNAGYDPKSATLQVEFVSGGTYRHYNVPEEVWVGLRSSYSAGRYYAMNLKNRYGYERVN